MAQHWEQFDDQYLIQLWDRAASFPTERPLYHMRHLMGGNHDDEEHLTPVSKAFLNTSHITTESWGIYLSFWMSSYVAFVL